MMNKFFSSAAALAFALDKILSALGAAWAVAEILTTTAARRDGMNVDRMAQL